MSTIQPGAKGVEKDAEAAEEKFGELADVYAEARSEAAKIAGREADRKHWEEVAATVEEPGD